MKTGRPVVRRATPADADAVAVLLDEFNLEFQCPTPGSEVLARRLRVLLAGDRVAVFLAGQPAFAVAVVTFRPNVWYDGPVALLDELYVAPAHRNRGTGAQLLAAVEDVTRSSWRCACRDRCGRRRPRCAAVL